MCRVLPRGYKKGTNALRGLGVYALEDKLCLSDKTDMFYMSMFFISQILESDCDA